MNSVTPTKHTAMIIPSLNIFHGIYAYVLVY
jgi:hypothetical protein